jgi:hypothetical protein
MKLLARTILVIFLLATGTLQLPAPIQEVPETPKPEPAPKLKRITKPKAASLNTESSTKQQTSSLQLKNETASNRTPFNIPQSQIRASATSQHSGYEASKAIDGNVSTIWHTDFSRIFNQPSVSLPQSIMLNLGGIYDVNALHYLPRQDGSLYGAILSYRVYVSIDGSHFTLTATGNWTDDHTEKTVTFVPTRASYIRLEAVAGHAGYASVAELNVTATR